MKFVRIDGPEVVWSLGPDDANHGFIENLKRGFPPNTEPRHLHTTFEFRQHQIHIDFFSHHDAEGFLIFSNGRFLTKGGKVHTKYFAYRYNWDIFAYVWDGLVTIQDPYKVGSFGFEALNMRFWEPKPSWSLFRRRAL